MTLRKDFTAGEQYAIKQALEPFEQAAAKARQQAGTSADGKAGGRGKKNLTLQKGKVFRHAREVSHRSAKAAGTSAATLAKITAVMESGFPDLVEKMQGRGARGAGEADRREAPPESRPIGAQLAFIRLLPIVCEQCGTDFTPRRRRRDGRFCRPACRARWHQAQCEAVLAELAAVLARAAVLVDALREGREH